MIAELLRHGYEVLIAPYSDNLRYDLVLDLGDRLARVQVKTGRLVNGAVTCATSSTRGHYSRRSDRSRRDYRGQCELFAVYCADTDRVYLVPVDDCGRRELALRVEPARNGQERRVRWARDYEVKAFGHG